MRQQTENNINNPLQVRKKQYRKGDDRDNLWGTLWHNLWAGDRSGSDTKKNQSLRRSSVFPTRCTKTVAQLTPPTRWVSALQLSLWDNIFGPRVEQIWNGSEILNEEVESSVSRHTLAGELLQEELNPDSKIETKFHLFAESGYFVSAMLFTAPHRDNTSKFSLAIVIKREYLQRYLSLHTIIQDRMFNLTSKLRTLYKKNSTTALTQFTPLLPLFVEHLEGLFYSGLPTIKFSSTLFSGSSSDVELGQEFLVRALTSHLQTNGATIIVGSNINKVNRFIDSFSLFLTPLEKQRSSHADPNRGYIPDLLLQGIVGTQDNVIENIVIQGQSPSTLIDLDHKQVKQTHPYHEYTVLRREYQTLEIQQLKKEGKEKEEEGGEKGNEKSGLSWATQEGLFKPLKAPSPYVVALLAEIFSLSPSVREGFIDQSMRLLKRKAVVLIKNVEAEMTQHEALEAGSIKRIRANLEATTTADFLILMGIAEKLRPGIYVTLAGDPESMEERFIELFEAF